MADFTGDYGDVGATHHALGEATIQARIFAAIAVAQTQEVIAAQQQNRPPSHVVSPMLMMKLLDPGSTQNISPFADRPLAEMNALSQPVPQIRGAEVEAIQRVPNPAPPDLALSEREQALLRALRESNQQTAPTKQLQLKSSPSPKGSWDSKIRKILLLSAISLGLWQAYPYISPWIDWGEKEIFGRANPGKAEPQGNKNPEASATPKPEPSISPSPSNSPNPSLNLGSLEPVGCFPTPCQ